MSSSFVSTVNAALITVFTLTSTVALAADQATTKPFRTGNEKLVDNPVDVWMHAHTGPGGRAVEGPFRYRHGGRYEILDTTDPQSGDFAVVLTVNHPDKDKAFGFFTGQFIASWHLSDAFTLQLTTKADVAPADGAVVALYDTAGKRATHALADFGAAWKEYALPLKAFDAEQEFNFTTLRAVQVEAALPKGTRVWLDGVVFRHGEEHFGVSDKTITQYMAEAKATRKARQLVALNEPIGAKGAPCSRLAKALWQGKDLDQTNKDVLKYIEQWRQGGGWGLFTGSAVHWMYFGFGSKGKLKPGRLYPETENALLDFYWDYTLYKNDIATTRRGPWVVAGSENHDINAKHKNLLASQMFMHHPKYAKRVLPNLGRMVGYGYGSGFAARVGVAPEHLKMKLGSGNYKDGKDYTSADHYAAWVKFWKLFFAERAKHGFFIEHNATGYMSHTGRFLHDIYAWSEDEELRKQTRMFLDLVYAQWAQDQLLTQCGGAATRGLPGAGRLGNMAQYFMGGPCWLKYAFSDYQWPRELWELVLDRRGKGEYAFVSRKPNEEQDIWPRPAGTENSFMIRPDSRLARYSWCTPDYVMGLRQDHPDALYCHLFVSGQGIIFATSPHSAIRFSAGLSYKAVQHRSVALLAPKITHRQRSPEWFPGYLFEPKPVQVAFGKGLKKIVEKDGWVFVAEGNAYVALRIVSPAEAKPGNHTTDDEGFVLLAPLEDAYEWQDDIVFSRVKKFGPGRGIVARDPKACLIVEASRKANHPTFEAFQADILDNPIAIRAVILGSLVSYTGCGKDAAKLEMNCASHEAPKINGKHLTYNPPTFDSPYLKGASGNGVITLGRGDQDADARLQQGRTDRKEGLTIASAQ
jgi:hypothetical protein